MVKLTIFRGLNSQLLKQLLCSLLLVQIIKTVRLCCAAGSRSTASPVQTQPAVVTRKLFDGKANKCTCHSALPFSGLKEASDRNPPVVGKVYTLYFDCICSKPLQNQLFKCIRAVTCLCERIASFIHIFQGASNFLSCVSHGTCFQVRNCNFVPCTT